MYQLTYISTAIPNITRQHLDDILEEANIANALNNISGCLIYHDGHFVQILEGDKKDLLDIYKKIEADPRHHSVSLLWENEVETKFFAQWNMAFYRPSDANVKAFVENLLMLSEYADRSSNSQLLFWATVSKILRSDTTRTHHKAY